MQDGMVYTEGENRLTVCALKKILRSMSKLN